MDDGGLGGMLPNLLEHGGLAVVVWWLLVRLEKRLDRLADQVEALARQLAVLLDRQQGGSPPSG